MDQIDYNTPNIIYVSVNQIKTKLTSVLLIIYNSNTF